MTRKFVKRSIFFLIILLFAGKSGLPVLEKWPKTYDWLEAHVAMLWFVFCWLYHYAGRTDRQKVRNYFQILIRNFWCIKVLFFYQNFLKFLPNVCQTAFKMFPILFSVGIWLVVFNFSGSWSNQRCFCAEEPAGKSSDETWVFPTEPFADNNTSQTQLCHKKSNPGSPVSSFDIL